MNNLIIISAPSGAGKTTICKKILKRINNISFSVSCTTRSPRYEEINGIDYFFLSQNTFELKIKNKEFIEWERIHGNFYYGTLKKTIEDVIKSNSMLLLELDVKGANTIMKAYPGNYLSIFIQPPDKQELIKRLKKRGSDSIERITQRLDRLESELLYKKDFDYVVNNDNVEIAVKKIISIIKK